MSRYSSNAAALPAGAKRAGELNHQAMAHRDNGPRAFELLGRMIRAENLGDFALVGVLIEEARGLALEVGGIL